MFFVVGERVGAVPDLQVTAEKALDAACVAAYVGEYFGKRSGMRLWVAIENGGLVIGRTANIVDGQTADAYSFDLADSLHPETRVEVSLQ